MKYLYLFGAFLTVTAISGFYFTQNQTEETKEVAIPALGAWDEKIDITESDGQASLFWNLYNLNVDNLMIRSLAKTVNRGKLQTLTNLPITHIHIDLDTNPLSDVRPFIDALYGSLKDLTGYNLELQNTNVSCENFIDYTLPLELTDFALYIAADNFTPIAAMLQGRDKIDTIYFDFSDNSDHNLGVLLSEIQKSCIGLEYLTIYVNAIYDSFNDWTLPDSVEYFKLKTYSTDISYYTALFRQGCASVQKMELYLSSMDILIEQYDNGSVNLKISVDMYYMDDDFDFNSFFKGIGDNALNIGSFELTSKKRSSYPFKLTTLDLDVLFSMIEVQTKMTHLRLYFYDMTLNQNIMENLEDVIYDKATEQSLKYFKLMLNYYTSLSELKIYNELFQDCKNVMGSSNVIIERDR